MSAASGFITVDFLLTPPHSPPVIAGSKPKSYVDSVDDLIRKSQVFENCLSAVRKKISLQHSWDGLEENVVGPIRIVCHSARELTERAVARAVLEKWKPLQEKSVREIALRLANLFADAAVVMREASKKLTEFRDTGSALYVDGYVKSMEGRIAVLSDIAHENHDGVCLAVKRILQEIETAGPGLIAPDLPEYLQLGEKFVSAAPDLAFLSLSGKYLVFAAMSLIQNLAVWVSELGHESGPFSEAIPAHLGFAESIHDCVACIVHRAEASSISEIDVERKQFENSLRTALRSQLDDMHKTLQLDPPKFGADDDAAKKIELENASEEFITQKIKRRAQVHLSAAVQIFKDLFQYQFEESAKIKAETKNVRVLAFQSKRYTQPNLQWAAHCLEFNLVAYGADSQSALETLLELMRVDLEFRAECGLEARREIDSKLEHGYEDLARSGCSEAFVSELNVAGRLVRLKILTEPSAAS